MERSDNAVAGLPPLKSDKRYTYADYRTWPEEKRWELVDGVAYAMSPAPRYSHQRLASLLMTRLGAWF